MTKYIVFKLLIFFIIVSLFLVMIQIVACQESIEVGQEEIINDNIEEIANNKTEIKNNQSYDISENNPNELSEDEFETINNYVKTVSIEDGVGQLLMVGVPADIHNFENNPNLKTLICDLGIGNLSMNTYNYYNYKYYQQENKNEFLSKVINFHNYLQKLTIDSKTQLPLLLGLNFEGPYYSSIQQVLIQSPPALTLASTLDPDLIKKTGKLVGNQLFSLGFNILFGPVIDIDLSEQGDANTIIRNRCFGSNPELVYNISTHYILGVKESGILVIGKHFPGLGYMNYDENMKNICTASVQEFSNNLIPYSHFNKVLDGVMTDHLRIEFFDSDKPVTFLKTFVTDLLRNSDVIKISEKELKGLNYKNQVIITDDLSDMKSIITYMQEEKKSFSQIAIEAFDAGHDILLFSHLETAESLEENNKKFTFKELENVREALIEHIRSSPTLELQFRESLKRIIILKLKMVKNYGYSISQLIGRDSLVWSRPLNYDLDSILNPDFIKDEYLGGSVQFIKEVIDSSITEINKETSYDLYNKPNNLKVAFYIYENEIDHFKDIFKDRFHFTKFVPLPLYQDKEEFTKIKTDISEDIKNYDLLIYTLLSPDDANILEYVFLELEKEVKSKLIILVHSTPKLIKPELLNNSTILGTFTLHSASFITDIDTLMGKITPNSIDHLTVSLGVNGSFYNANKSNLTIEPAKGFDQLLYFATENEEKLFNENSSLKIELKEELKVINKLELEKIELESKIEKYILKFNLTDKTIRYIIPILSWIIFILLTCMIFLRRKSEKIKKIKTHTLKGFRELISLLWKKFDERIFMSLKTVWKKNRILFFIYVIALITAVMSIPWIYQTLWRIVLNKIGFN